MKEQIQKLKNEINKKPPKPKLSFSKTTKLTIEAGKVSKDLKARKEDMKSAGVVTDITARTIYKDETLLKKQSEQLAVIRMQQAEVKLIKDEIAVIEKQLEDELLMKQEENTILVQHV